MLELVLKGLLMINFDSADDGDEVGPHQASWFTLQRMSVLLADSIRESVVAFSGRNISSPDWRHRYAALMALGSISEGTPKNEFQNTVFQAMPAVLPMFQDQAQKVREILCWFFGRLAEHHVQLFGNQEFAKETIPRLQQAILDEPRVSKRACETFEKLAEIIYQDSF